MTFFASILLSVASLNAQANDSTKTDNKTGVFTLLEGNCHEDGCTFTFRGEKGDTVYVHGLPETPLIKFVDNDYGGRDVLTSCTNKKYVLNYKIEMVYFEPADATNPEMVVTAVSMFIE